MADASAQPRADARRQYLSRWGALKQERSSWMSHWREISDYLLPRSGRFFLADRNRGGKRHNNIYDSTGTRALRVLAAGMMAGMTSPARPWFRLATPDPDLMEWGSVKLWLDFVSKIMRDVFARSNTYRALHSVYEELGGFGTAADVVLGHFDSVIHHDPLTAGEYAIAAGADGRVNVLYREFELPAARVVEEFGRANVSNVVRNLVDQPGGGYDSWVPLVHAIEPRRERDARRRDARNMPFKSCYFESGSNDPTAQFLRESGFRRFPALCPRWHTAGGDIYGNAPAMEALGDVKQLQHQQWRKAQAIDYKVRPPLQLPVELKEQPLATLPGGAAFVTATSERGGIRSQFDVSLDLSHLLNDIQDVRSRINSTFYVDLFLFMQQLDSLNRSGNITAREIAERHEEKLIMLGPVLERLHDELLKPLVDVTFDHLLEAGVLPPPPEELSGQDLNVEFVSMLAQAQRAVGIGSVDRLLGTVMALNQVQAVGGRTPTATDKLDVDQIVDKVSDMLGVDPDLIVSDDKVAVVRKERADALAAQQQAQMIQGGAAVAKDLAAAKLTEPSALTALTGGYGGPDTGL